MRDNLEAIFAGQHHVEHNRVEWMVGAQSLQRFFAGLDDLDLVPFGLEVKFQTAGEVRFVFHHQQRAHAAPVPAVGSLMVMVAPRPSPSLSAYASPPCFRAMERTRKSPSPVPFTGCAT